MTKAYLIINENNIYLQYKDKYLVISDREKALDKLEELGWESSGIQAAFGPPSDEIGVASMQQDSDCKLTFIPIEIT